MSVISSRHQVLPFVSGKSAALSGQRMLKIGYKSTKEGGKVIPPKYPPHFASVPFIGNLQTLMDEINFSGLDALSESIIGYIETLQNDTAKAVFESADGKLDSLADSEINLHAINRWLLESSPTMGRLTKETISQWFTESLAENWGIMVADKLRLSDNPDALRHPAVIQQVNICKANFEGLSNPNATFSDLQLKNMKGGLELCENTESSVFKRIAAKIVQLEKPLPPPPVEELALF